jgi:hypothetical protein
MASRSMAARPRLMSPAASWRRSSSPTAHGSVQGARQRLCHLQRLPASSRAQRLRAVRLQQQQQQQQQGLALRPAPVVRLRLQQQQHGSAGAQPQLLAMLMAAAAAAAATTRLLMQAAAAAASLAGGRRLAARPKAAAAAAMTRRCRRLCRPAVKTREGSTEVAAGAAAWALSWLIQMTSRWVGGTASGCIGCGCENAAAAASLVAGTPLGTFCRALLVCVGSPLAGLLPAPSLATLARGLRCPAGWRCRRRRRCCCCCC